MRLSLIAIAFGLLTSQMANANTISEQMEQQAKQISVLQTQLEKLVQQQDSTSATGELSPFSFSSYGTLNYRNIEVFKNVQDVTPERRGQVDVERLVTEFGYRFNKQWKVEFELEFEHGGTGSTLEYDGFEEFGEFETEIEVGGEVVVEKLELEYQHSDAFGVKLGHIYVPVGLASSHHKPHQYYTVRRHQSVENMLPSVWHETGVGVFGQVADFHYQAQVVTGLNSEYFRTYNWVAAASQKRFETVNADDLAMVIRLDYGNVKDGNAIGFSYYTSSTSGNRHKTNQLDVSGDISILDLHGVYSQGNFNLRGQYLLGQLDNSNEIANANRNTPGLHVGNFAQLGSESQALFVEAGYNIADMTNLTNPLHVFVSYDYSNPLEKVDSEFSTNRFELTELSMGVNYFPTKNLVLKGQISTLKSAMAEIPNTNSFELGLGYYFSL